MRCVICGRIDEHYEKCHAVHDRLWDELEGVDLEEELW